eukprot:RCo033451
MEPGRSFTGFPTAGITEAGDGLVIPVTGSATATLEGTPIADIVLVAPNFGAELQVPTPTDDISVWGTRGCFTSAGGLPFFAAKAFCNAADFGIAEGWLVVIGL